MTNNSVQRPPFLVGNIVEILPEFQDPGDDEFTWVVVGNEEKGRVNISPVDIGLAIIPNMVVTSDQIRHKL